MTLISASFAAAWLGLLTSVSPCQLGTNIAAVSLKQRDVIAALAALAQDSRLAIYRLRVKVSYLTEICCSQGPVCAPVCAPNNAIERMRKSA